MVEEAGEGGEAVTDPVEAAAPAKKKRKKPSPLRTRSLKWFRARGWAMDNAERKNRFISYDFLGFADLVGIKFRCKPLAVQVTSDAHRAEHLDKMLTGDGACGCRDWLAQEGVIVLMCWGLRRDPAAPGKKGAGAKKWRVTSMDWIDVAEGQEAAPVPVLDFRPCDMELFGALPAPGNNAASQRPSHRPSGGVLHAR
jgi:hypothetical protein